MLLGAFGWISNCSPLLTAACRADCIPASTLGAFRGCWEALPVPVPTGPSPRVEDAVCWIGSENVLRRTTMATETPSPAQQFTGDEGTHAVLECVGTQDAIDAAIGAVRDGGAIGRVGAAQYTDVPMNFDTVMRNITLTGGVAPARAYIEELMPDILSGTIQPGQVFDQTVALDDVAAGYCAMADRTALKVLIRP
ncbi:zinc-binding dehydrogenase [Pseudarthrobacter sp. PvP022]|uniref:zinc-binding dehydrogenase n=1 Tax=Pseudarthrobacter sp. PvP022 TaxID=3156433 RepID=UPI0033995E2C